MKFSTELKKVKLKGLVTYLDGILAFYPVIRIGFNLYLL